MHILDAFSALEDYSVLSSTTVRENGREKEAPVYTIVRILPFGVFTPRRAVLSWLPKLTESASWTGNVTSLPCGGESARIAAIGGCGGDLAFCARMICHGDLARWISSHTANPCVHPRRQALDDSDIACQASVCPLLLPGPSCR